MFTEMSNFSFIHFFFRKNASLQYNELSTYLLWDVVVWHQALGQKGIALIDIQNTLLPIYNQSIVQHECLVLIDSSLSSLHAVGSKG